MMGNFDELQHQRFFDQVTHGLKSIPKFLDAKYFYDKRGDLLFQQIMALPEYYLTRCELDIFKNKTKELAQGILALEEPFDIIELGAGDASKSTYLLDFLIREKRDFSYLPIDISPHILSVLRQRLQQALPDLSITPLPGEFMDKLGEVALLSNKPKVLLFLGSNIGNMELAQAGEFCQELRNKMKKGDLLLMGFDLKKDPHLILKAYDDPSGVTAAFNLNLLSRINQELGANFQPDQFQHYAAYNPITGACRSYLISITKQSVHLGAETINFDPYESISMEISQKFSLIDIKRLGAVSGFKSCYEVFDSKGWFVDVIWQAV